MRVLLPSSDGRFLRAFFPMHDECECPQAHRAIRLGAPLLRDFLLTVVWARFSCTPDDVALIVSLKRAPLAVGCACDVSSSKTRTHRASFEPSAASPLSFRLPSRPSSLSRKRLRAQLLPAVTRFRGLQCSGSRGPSCSSPESVGARGNGLEL